jgi:hypothetical protein
MNASAPGRRAKVTKNADDTATLVVEGPRYRVEKNLEEGDPLNYGYEGCDALYLAFHGERAIAIAHGARGPLLWSVSGDGTLESVSLQRGWVRDGDLLVWPSHDEPALAIVFDLLSFRALAPLPLIPIDPRHATLAIADGALQLTIDVDDGLDSMQRLRLGRKQPRRTLPAARLPEVAQRVEIGDASDVLGRVARAIIPDGDIGPVVQLVVDAIALPFARGPLRSGSSPVFLPIYLHAHYVREQRDVDAAALVGVMDVIAHRFDPEQEPGWDPAWTVDRGTIALAARHVRRLCGVFAAACRDRKLPSGWYSHLSRTSAKPHWSPALLDAHAAIGEVWPDVKAWPFN